MKMLWMIWEWLCCCRLYVDAVLCIWVHACIIYKGCRPATYHAEDMLVEMLARFWNFLSGTAAGRRRAPLKAAAVKNTVTMIKMNA